MPFFSVVIPIYNKQFFIENTLKSLLDQDFRDFEVIIINDGSTDESEKIVLGFDDPRIRYFSQINQGVALARNHGFEKATARYIAFLDADDFWHPDFLEVMHQYILRLPDQKVFASAIEIGTSKTIFEPGYSIKKTGDYAIVDYFEASVKESVIWTSSAVFERSVFEQAGTFDPKIKISEDTDLWIRIGLLFPVVFIWKVLARYVYDESSISRSADYLFRDESFTKYENEEKQHPKLKKFLDLNRFSAAIKSKLIGDNRTFFKYKQAIDPQNLNIRKRILLELPAFMLQFLIRIKTFLANIGLGNAVFK